MDIKDHAKRQGVTLNSLLEEQQALNMRMLLAIQLRDTKTQEELRADLEKVALRIEQLLSGELRRQDLPQ